MEYFRTETHQAVDVELYLVLDTITGEPTRFTPPPRETVGSLAEAQGFLKSLSPAWWDRTIIVKLAAIQLLNIER